MNIGFIFFIIIGVAVTFFLLRNAKRGLDSKGWPTTWGTVLASNVTRSTSTDDDGSTSTNYGAKITYEYKVGGEKYFGDRRSFAEYTSSSSARAYRIAHKYPAGSQVTVYYHPHKPGLCVLEPGVNWSTFVLAGIGLLLTTFGILGLLGIIG